MIEDPIPLELDQSERAAYLALLAASALRALGVGAKAAVDGVTAGVPAVGHAAAVALLPGAHHAVPAPAQPVLLQEDRRMIVGDGI